MRIKTKSLGKYPWYVRPFFWKQKRKYGQVLIPGMLWGRVPWLFMTIASVYGVLDRRKSPINPVLRSMITVRVSQINWCRFCVDINSATLAKRSGSMAKVDALENWRDETIYNDEERVVLDYCESMTDSNKQVTDEQIVKLREFFDEDGIAELTGLIAFQNLSSKFNSALDVQPQGFCKIPDADAGKSNTNSNTSPNSNNS
ncbi:MAG: carboxymuconolactone decarboxylase family protein [Gammaproteobacteria bacterium]|nr:carboxymuconolactone decarboxylase family protein [Gammaproteobacteria bacterium]